MQAAAAAWRRLWESPWPGQLAWAFAPHGRLIATKPAMPFQLVLITPERTLPNEAQLAAQLLSRGSLQALHVRKPHSSPGEVLQFLQSLPPAARK